MARQRIRVGTSMANPAQSVHIEVQAIPITYTGAPLYISTARPKRSRNAETTMDVILIGHVMALPTRLKSCMSAGTRTKKPLVMYSSRTCEDEMAARNVASFQVKARQPERQRSSPCEDCGADEIFFRDDGLSMTKLVLIAAKLPRRRLFGICVENSAVRIYGGDSLSD
jgi:hypothetical protein